MFLNLQQLDTVSFSNKLGPNFACSTSEDGRISIVTETGVLIYRLVNYLDNIFSDIAFTKKFFKAPDVSLCSAININFESFYDEIPKEELFERVLRLDLTAKLDHSVPVEVKPISVAWSPKGLIGKSNCAICVLSNFYGLTIFAKHVDTEGIEEYKCVANVTNSIVDRVKFECNSGFNDGDKLARWDTLTADSCPTAFIWSHCINVGQEAFAILFVAHPTGAISSWKFHRRKELDDSPSDVEFCGRYQTNLENITTMYWTATSKNGGALSYGNLLGQVAVVSVPNLNEEIVEYKEEVVFWSERDQKRVDQIISLEHLGYTYLLAVKEEFLLVFAIDKDGSVFDEILFNTGYFPITGLSHYKENILMILSGGRLKKITLNIIESCVHIREDIIPLKLESAKFKTHGIVLSENRVFFGILAYPSRLKDITRDQTPSKFFIYYDSFVPLFETIFKNPSGSLEKYWDLFETLRLISYKEKKFPWLGIEDNLDYDKLSLLQLKTLRWVAKLSEKVYTVVPSIKEYKIKPYILLHYLTTIKLALKRIKKLMWLMADGVQLTTFQMRSIDVQVMFLKEMVLTDILEKAQVGESFVDEITEVIQIANELEYPDMLPCFWCGEKITGPSCIPPHADSRCIFSMMQIFLIPGFKCAFCKCVAHPEIAKEMDVVICPLCDIPMDQIYSSERVEEILEETDDKNLALLTVALQDDVPQQPVVACAEDCLECDVSLEGIEDNDVEYLAISDSEDGETLVDKMNTLRNQYFSSTRGAGNEIEVVVVPEENVEEKGNENSDYSFSEESENEEAKSKS